jgi:hypothetical protein
MPGRDAPFRGLEIEFVPSRVDQFGRANKGQDGQLQRRPRLGRTVIHRHLAQQLWHFFSSTRENVNHVVGEDPRLPFGGIKESGYGGEMATYGIKEFVNIKTVYVT